MRRLIVLLPLLAAFVIGCRSSSTPNMPVGGGDGNNPSPPNDRKLLQGTWNVVESSRPDGARERDREAEVRFAGDLMTFAGKDGKPAEQCRFSVSAATAPKQLDLVQLDAEGRPKAKKRMPKGPEVEAVTPGVYELNGDELVLVIAWTTDLSKRPKSLDLPEGDGVVRYRLERVK